MAIDDFIPSYSSLGYIGRLRPHEPKVDESLVARRDRDVERAGGAVAALAHSLQLVVVAEGGETEDEQAFLEAHGCDMAQGYLHARPVPVPGSGAWLMARTVPGAGPAAAAH